MKKIFRNMMIVGSFVTLTSGCSNLQHSSAMNVWGGLPVTPVCHSGDIDWTKLQKNNQYFGKFQEYGTRLGDGDYLRYNHSGTEVTAKIRSAKKEEYSDFSGYVVSYTEKKNNSQIEYNIPITSNLEHQKITVEMCGGANVRHAARCAAEKQYVQKELERHFYSSPEGARRSIMNFYKDGVFPGSGGKFTNDGRTYVDVFSKTSYGCDLIEDYRNFEKEIYEKNISCYTRTGNFCKK